MNLTGADIICEAIAEQNLKRIYVYPGGTIAPVLDAVTKRGIGIFCARHEQGAGYAAVAAARLTGRPQVVMVTSGPGVTNVITPVADAFFDSAPLVVLTGQVGTGDLRRDKPIRQSGFQEVDALALLAPVTKARFQPVRPEDLPEIMVRAFRIAAEGRPGPVLVDLPMNVQRDEPAGSGPAVVPAATAAAAPPMPEAALTEQAGAWIAAATRPVIIAGHGVLLAGAHEELRLLAEGGQIPVSQSLLGLGAFPGSSALALGFHGHTGNQYANRAIHEADLVLVVGSRLDIRQTGSRTGEFAPRGQIIRIDLDPDELAHSRVRADLNIHADARSALAAINDRLAGCPMPDRTAWLARIEEWRREFALSYETDGALKPQYVIETVNRLNAGQFTVCVSGVGSHQQWTARHFSFDFPRRIWLTSGGHGAMGFDLPAAIGAQLACPEAKVLCFVGDGSLQMNIQELATLAEYRLPVKVIVLDNRRLGLVSQFQKINWQSDPACGNKWNPDFAAIGRAYGIAGITVKTVAEAAPKLRQALSDEGPAVIHCIVDEAEDVVPMLLAGQTMDRMWPYE
jgi:acetolactate synthase-1/2/3 large subunit